MMKFFRKYMKHMLAVFMALLLVIWLTEGAITRMGQDGMQQNEKRGMAFGETVWFEDMQPVFNDLETLQAMGIDWQYAWGPLLADIMQIDMRMVNMRQASQYLMSMGIEPVRYEELSSNEWYMLDLAARKAGIEVSAEALARFKQRVGLSDYILSQIRDRFKVSLSQLDETLRGFVRVLEMGELAMKSVKPSEADIQEFVRQTQEKVRVSALIVGAGRFMDPDYQPTPEELQAQFEQGKDKPPVPGSLTEFGYLVPEKVQVEYIEIDAKALGSQQEVTEEEAREYWATHPEEFLKPVTQPATAPSTTQEAPPQPKPYETATEALPKVIEKLREQRGQIEAARLGRELIAQLRLPWLNQPTTQPGGYTVPPESETSADLYPKLIESLEARYPGALKYGRTSLGTQSELANERNVSFAQLLKGSPQSVSLLQAAFMVAGLKADPAANPGHALFFRNIWQTCSEPAVSWTGDAVYVFRTVAAQPETVPASVEDVKEKLVLDLRSKRAYAEAERIARDLLEKASSSGVKATYEASGELKAKLSLVTPDPFARQSPGGRSFNLEPGAPSSLAFGPGRAEMVELCFSMAHETTTQPANVKLHEQSDARRWMIVEFHELIPVTQKEYDDTRAEAFNRNLMQRHIGILRAWFDPQQIRERVEWQDINPPKTEEEKAEGETATPAEAEGG